MKDQKKKYHHFEAYIGLGSIPSLDNVENFKLKDIGKKIKDKVKDAIDAVKDLGQDAMLVPLLPMKGAMKKKLDAKGISHGDSLKDIVEKFYYNIVKGQQSFESFVDPVTLGIIVPAVLEFFKHLLEKIKSGTATADEIAIVDAANDAIAGFDPAKDVKKDVKDSAKDAGKSLDNTKGKTQSIPPKGKGDKKDLDVKVDNTVMIVLLIALALFIFKDKL